MRITNPVFLKRPWLFPVFIALGAVFGVFVAPQGISVKARVLVVIGIVTVANIWFFATLSKTRIAQAANIPDTNTEKMRTRLRYLMVTIGVLATVYAAVLYMTGRADLVWQLLLTAGYCFVMPFLWRRKPKALDKTGE